MTRGSLRLWPRSLAGQLATVIALALFAAQAINFALLLRERRQFALEQIAGPAAARFVDAMERPFRLRGDSGRVRLASRNPVASSEPTDASVEASLRSGLTEAGVRFGRIATALRPLDRNDPMLRRGPPRRADWLARNADELVIAVQRPGGGWLVQRMPWVRSDPQLVWQLVIQTLVLFVVLLLPLLWAIRRVSRPLHDLTRAAEQYGPGDTGDPMRPGGPDDVARLITAFNALRLRITAMLAEKDRMLGAIGHDLRTPLASLRVRIESVEDDNDRARMVDTVEEMNRTLDDILSLARLGRPSEQAVEVDVTALVDAVVEDFRDLGAPVTFVEGERLPLRLRPSLMRRAVRNLLENAIKYGGGAVVSVEAGACIVIRVADRGPGIPEARLEDVFEAFTRLETSRNRDTGGSGLGLALARAIAREAGGDVILTNRREGGLDAAITLPRMWSDPLAAKPQGP